MTNVFIIGEKKKNPPYQSNLSRSFLMKRIHSFLIKTKITLNVYECFFVVILICAGRDLYKAFL